MAVFGVLLIGVAGFFGWWDAGSRVDLLMLALNVSAIVYGGILGCVLSALLLKRRGGDLSTAYGLAAGVGLGLFFFFHQKMFGLERPWLAFPLVLPLQAALAFGVAALTPRDPSRIGAASGKVADGAR